MDVRSCKNLEEIEHIDVYVITGEVKKSEVAKLERFISRGGRVVVVADTPSEREAAKKLKGALILDSYDGVVDAILK